VAGIVAYFTLQRTINLHSVTRLPVNGKHVFDAAVAAVARVASTLTAALPFGRLRGTLACIFGAAIAATGLPLLRAGLGAPGGAPIAPGAGDALWQATGVVLFVVGAAAAIGTAACYRRRFLALVLLGTVGLMVSLAFVLLSAPDLALTQLLVEMASIMLMMLALHWLPPASPREAQRARNVLHVCVAVAAGLGTAALAFMVMTRPFDSIASYFLANAVSLGGGANAVNVIIVDFRGFDTLGEITVLGIAAIIIAALLVPGTRATAHRHASQPEPHSGQVSLMLALVSRLLLPFVVLVAIFLLLRGHNEPGGGFIAGLVLAIGLILQYVANGQRWTEERLPRDFSPWVGSGLLIAGLTGLASWLFGSPFLTSTYDYPHLPWFGPVPLASASVFDLGVFLTVVGATMMMLAALGRLQAVR